MGVASVGRLLAIQPSVTEGGMGGTEDSASRDRRAILGTAVLVFILQIIGSFAFQLRWTEHTGIFGSFWEAGRHLDYELHPMVWVPELGIPELNMNPPALLPLFQLFALFDPQVGQSVWLFICAAIHLSCVAALRKSATTVQLVWLLTAPMAITGIGLGQIYCLLFALGLLIWQALRSNRMLAAAVLVGILVAMKPNFAIWGFVAFAAGYFRTAMVAGAVALFLSLIPVFAYGPGIYEQWLTAAASDRHGLFPHDVSLWGYFSRLGIPGASVGIAAVLASTLFWAWYRKPSLNELTPVALLAAMLCSPLAWIDYLLTVAPFLVAKPWRASTALMIVMTYSSVFAPSALEAGPVLSAIVSSLCLAPVLGLWGLLITGTAFREDFPSGDHDTPTASSEPEAALEPAER